MPTSADTTVAIARLEQLHKCSLWMRRLAKRDGVSKLPLRRPR
jgi:hypothetical protein